MATFFSSLGIAGSLFEASQAAKQGRKSVKAVKAVPTGPVQKATTESLIGSLEEGVPLNVASPFITQAKRTSQAQGRAISEGIPGAAVTSTQRTRSGGRVARLLAAERERGGTVAAGEERLATLRRDVGTQRLGRLASVSRLESSQQVLRTKQNLLRKELFQRGRAGVGSALGVGIGTTIKALAGGA